MKKLLTLLVLLATQNAISQEFSVSRLANNKESHSRQVSRRDRKELKEWTLRHSFKGEQLKTEALAALTSTMASYMKRETQCDLGLPPLLSKSAIERKVIKTRKELPLLLTYLRESDLIDDIFLKIVKDSDQVGLALSAVPARVDWPIRPFNLYTRKNEKVDVPKMYSIVKSWPDDVEYCTLGRYMRLVNEIKWKDSKDRDSQMYKLNYIALQDKVITPATFYKLDTLLNMKVLDWHVNINGYLEVLNNAKDKLAKVPEPSTTTAFSGKYASRKQKLTHRGRLYKAFSSTQVMILAQLIEKTAKRMDARHVGLNFQYTDDPHGETETYVLSPMEQYRVSIKMLRKDMAEIMRSENFRGTGVEYADLVSAAFETGLIKSEELDHIVKFEDFWNPKTPKWKTYANFAFSLAGTASFFLPTPWNVVGAIALVVTQSKFLNKKTPDSDDNWNAIL